MRIIKDNPLTRAFSAIRELASDPLQSLGVMLPAAIMLTGLVSAILACVNFVREGGYTRQIETIKTDGLFNSLNSNFTGGTAGTVTGGWAGIVMYLLILAQLVLLGVIFWRKAHVAARIPMILELILAFVWGVLFFTVMGYRLGDRYVINADFAINTLNSLTTSGHDINTYFRFFYLGGFVLLALFAVTFLLKLESRRPALDLLTSGVFSFLLIPLLVLIVQNALPIFVLIVLFAVVWFVFGIVSSMTKSEGGSEGATSGSPARPAKKSESSGKTPEKKAESGPPQKRFDIGFSTKIWRDKGGLGIAAPTDDCIYFKNNIDAPQWICTVLEFEKGDCAVYMNNKRIMDVAGCKKPAR